MKINFHKAKKRVVNAGLTFYEFFDSGNFEFSIAELNGNHREYINKYSDRIYFFLDGQAYLTVGEEVFECGENDLILIPKNTRYGVSGKARFIKITSPPFSPASEPAS